MPELETLKLLAQHGPTALFAFLVLWISKKDREASDVRYREDRAASEERYEALAENYRAIVQDNTVAMTKLLDNLQMQGRTRLVTR